MRTGKILNENKFLKKINSFSFFNDVRIYHQITKSYNYMDQRTLLIFKWESGLVEVSEEFKRNIIFQKRNKNFYQKLYSSLYWRNIG